ncbi:hypothetical protein Cni_G27236 [Canna indica]|uniref:Uncharacterized protein n=1 Tax=Canna indica TaxID=4628 RepID=A0AAQ3QMS7_9LILI|nr:hypothetical protein Cni_G27236 [Canna indica]
MKVAAIQELDLDEEEYMAIAATAEAANSYTGASSSNENRALGANALKYNICTRVIANAEDQKKELEEQAFKDAVESVTQLLSLIELKLDTCRKMSKEYRETARQRFIITHNLDELMREAGRQKQRPGPSDEDEDINPGENDEVIDDDLYS